MDPYQEPLVLPLSPLHTLWWIGSQSSNPLTPAPWTKDNWSSASASHWLKTNSRVMEKGERKVFVWSIEVCRRCWYWISWSSIRMPLLCIYPHGPLMGFIRIGANQYEWVDSGQWRCGWGILHFKTMISPPVCSPGRSVFIHKVCPFTQARAQKWAHKHMHMFYKWLLSLKDAVKTIQPMREYFGEITAPYPVLKLPKCRNLAPHWITSALQICFCHRYTIFFLLHIQQIVRPLRGKLLTSCEQRQPVIGFYIFYIQWHRTIVLWLWNLINLNQILVLFIVSTGEV